MKAILTRYNQSPRKVRLVADLVKGKRVPEALATLTFLNKRAAEPVAKLIRSAVANAAQKETVKKENLRIASITVDTGETLRRYRARAFGRGATIRRRRSRIAVTLTEDKSS